MTLSPPPIKDGVLAKNGVLSDVYLRWFRSLHQVVQRAEPLEKTQDQVAYEADKSDSRWTIVNDIKDSLLAVDLDIGSITGQIGFLRLDYWRNKFGIHKYNQRVSDAPVVIDTDYQRVIFGTEIIEGPETLTGRDYVFDPTTPTSVVGPHDQNASTIIIPSGIGSPSYNNMQDYLNLCQSGGRLTGGVLAAHAGPNGTLDISEMEGFIHTGSTLTSLTVPFKKAAYSGLALTDNAVNYIWITYSAPGGVPTLTYSANASRPTDAYGVWVVGRAWRSGNDVEVLSTGQNVFDMYGRQQDRLLTKYGAMDHASGGTISAHATPLRLQSDAGIWYFGNSRINTGAADTVRVWYKSGSATWVESAELALFSAIFNGAAATVYTSYQNGNAIGSLGANKYGVYWIFICPEGDMYVVMGTAAYANIAAAQAASVPASLPPYCVNWSRLVGRVIIQNAGAAFYTVESVWNTAFTQSAAVDHAGLFNLAYADSGHTGFVSQDQTTGQTIGSTGARLTKLWATDITCTNAITGAVTGNAGTVSNATFTTAFTNQGGAGVLVWPAAGATLTIPTGGGTLGTAAFTAATAYLAAAGTATKATILETARTINGVSFDGSASVPGRELLEAWRTYYVRTDGNDSNTGLVNSAEGAFLTPQKAIDVLSSTIDCGIYNLTMIQIIAGTYDGNITLQPCVGVQVPVITGDVTTPSNVVLTCTSGTLISANGFLLAAAPRWRLRGLKFTNSSTGTDCVAAQNGAVLWLGKCDFGAAGSAHMSAQGLAVINILDNYTISGGAVKHFNTNTGGVIRVVGGSTTTVSGTPAFSTAFAFATSNGTIDTTGMTFSGSATGPRYYVDGCGVIQTGGGGATYFPGNSAGTADGTTGGYYL